MSRVERKEYQETKIMRTVSPVRGTRGSSQNLVEFDQNLDNLLEDLQSSVSRPSSSLGHTNANSYREVSKHVNNYDTARTNSLNRVTHLKASNPVTEYSSDDSYSYTVSLSQSYVKKVKVKQNYSRRMEQEVLRLIRKNRTHIKRQKKTFLLKECACKIISINWILSWTIFNRPSKHLLVSTLK